jgi:hypothetical protein
MKDDIAVSKKEEDLLDRYPFAEHIAKSIFKSFDKNHEGIVVGIKGSWGSGKSTLANFIKSELEIRGKEQKLNFQIIEFNPWMFSGQEDLQKAFLIELAKKMRRWKEENEKLSKDIESIGNSIEKFNELNPEPHTKTIGKVFSWGVKRIAQSLSPFHGIQDLKKTVDEGLQGSDMHLFIFIDDIDRLTPYEISQIFKLVKLNLNFRNTIFFVCYDGLVVEQALKVEYGEFGKKYLEKIIQIDYKVPEILNEKIEELFFDELKKFIGEAKIQYDTNELIDVWAYHGLSGYFRTLRDIYRFMNAMKLSLPAIWEDINVTDFILLEAIRIFDYDAFEYLQRNYSSVKENTDKSLIPQLVNNQATTNISTYLFQRQEPFRVFRGESSKRFNEDEYYERYSSFKISKSDISEIDLKIFLFDDQNRFDLLKRTFKENRYKNLLRRLSNPKLNDHYNLIDDKYFSVLLRFWDDEKFALIDNRNDLWAALINLATSDSKSSHGMNQLISELTIRLSGLSYTRLLFLSQLKSAIDDDFQHELSSVKNTVLKRRIVINSVFDHYVSHFYERGFIELRNASLDFYNRIVIENYAFLHKEEYLNSLTGILNSDSNRMFFVRLFLMINYRTKEPFKLDFRTAKYTLPGRHFPDFISSLDKINPNLLAESSDLSEKYLEFYKANSEGIANYIKREHFI